MLHLNTEPNIEKISEQDKRDLALGTGKYAEFKLVANLLKETGLQMLASMCMDREKTTPEDVKNYVSDTYNGNTKNPYITDALFTHQTIDKLITDDTELSQLYAMALRDFAINADKDDTPTLDHYVDKLISECKDILKNERNPEMGKNEKKTTGLENVEEALKEVSEAEKVVSENEAKNAKEETKNADTASNERIAQLEKEIEKLKEKDMNTEKIFADMNAKIDEAVKDASKAVKDEMQTEGKKEKRPLWKSVVKYGLLAAAGGAIGYGSYNYFKHGSVFGEDTTASGW